MPDIPNSPTSDDNADDQADLQGYQDDFDTSKRDQAINEEAEAPYGDTPATRAEFAQGLRDTAIPEQEGGQAQTFPNSDDSEPPMASADDYREEVEDRDEDEKEQPGESWLKN